MKKLEEMTFNEKLLRRMICDMRNEIIGGFENTVADNDEAYCEEIWPVKDRTKEVVVDEIMTMIFNGTDKYLKSSSSPFMLEKKHIKFMGKKFVRELVEDRVEWDYKKHGWDFPNNYSGDLK